MDFLREAMEEERQLVARLEAVRAVIRAYGSSSAAEIGQTATQGSPARVTRSASARTQQVKAIVRELLMGREEPTPTRDIVAHLDGRGIEIAGKSKVASLSALLSHSGEFEPIGRLGWIIRKSEAPNVTASGAAPSDEVQASSVEGHPDGVRTD